MDLVFGWLLQSITETSGQTDHVERVKTQIIYWVTPLRS